MARPAIRLFRPCANSAEHVDVSAYFPSPAQSPSYSSFRRATGRRALPNMDESNRTRQLPGTPFSVERARSPAKARQNVVIELAFDGQIARQSSLGGHVAPNPFDVGNNRRQTGRRRLALADFDGRAREGALHNLRATPGEADIAGNAAACAKTADEAENAGGRVGVVHRVIVLGARAIIKHPVMGLI